MATSLQFYGCGKLYPREVGPLTPCSVVTPGLQLYASLEATVVLVTLLSAKNFLLQNHTRLKNSFFWFDTCDLWNIFSSAKLWDHWFAFWIKNEKLCSHHNNSNKSVPFRPVGILEFVGAAQPCSVGCSVTCLCFVGHLWLVTTDQAHLPVICLVGQLCHTCQVPISRLITSDSVK